MNIYLVGGAVRDTLLGIEVLERDWVVVGGTENDLKRSGYKKIGKDFPVFLHPDSKEEYALARKERKSGLGHKAFEFEFDSSVTLEEDLLRRDLTINAIAQDEGGKLIDPYNGIKDIENKDTPRLKLVVKTQHALNELALNRVLVGICGLHVDIVISDGGGEVKITIEGETSAADIEMAAKILCPHLLEFLDITPKWQDGVLGLMQLITLSHISQVLTKRFIK